MGMNPQAVTVEEVDDEGDHPPQVDSQSGSLHLPVMEFNIQEPLPGKGNNPIKDSRSSPIDTATPAAQATEGVAEGHSMTGVPLVASPQSTMPNEKPRSRSPPEISPSSRLEAGPTSQRFNNPTHMPPFFMPSNEWVPESKPEAPAPSSMGVNGNPEYPGVFFSPNGNYVQGAAQNFSRQYSVPGSPQSAEFFRTFSPGQPGQPRQPGPFPRMPPMPPMQMPQPQEFPLTGYELLAAKLSGSIDGPPISPIYRRFGYLHHRLLLGLQDELSFLEEQLQELDTTDTQNRGYLGGFVPASRRLEVLEPNDLSVARKAILDSIAFKLFQYNQQLVSFNKTGKFAGPDMGEIQSYKGYLAATSPVIPTETSFLDAGDDLICLSRYKPGHVERSPLNVSRGRTTPMPRPAFPATRAGNFVPEPVPRRNWSEPMTPPKATVSLKGAVLGACAAIVLPMLTFRHIPWFLGRMAVATVVGLVMLLCIFQLGYFTLTENRSLADLVLFTSAYGAIMAVVANTYD